MVAEQQPRPGSCPGPGRGYGHLLGADASRAAEPLGTFEAASGPASQQASERANALSARRTDLGDHWSVNPDCHEHGRAQPPLLAGWIPTAPHLGIIHDFRLHRAGSGDGFWVWFRFWAPATSAAWFRPFRSRIHRDREVESPLAASGEGRKLWVSGTRVASVGGFAIFRGLGLSMELKSDSYFSACVPSLISRAGMKRATTECKRQLQL